MILKQKPLLRSVFQTRFKSGSGVAESGKNVVMDASNLSTNMRVWDVNNNEPLSTDTLTVYNSHQMNAQWKEY